MRRIFLTLWLCLSLGLSLAGTAFAAPNDAPWDQLSRKYVKPYTNGVNYFDYGALKANAADTAALRAYVMALQQEKVSALTRPQQFVYWVNLYNALTVRVMIDNWPVKSIRDIPSKGAPFDPVKSAFGGPWRQKFVTVEGQPLTLDEIEHEILRAEWSEPRVHYAVNCASFGCPNLRAGAWKADTLDADLTAAAKAYVNNSRGVQVNANGSLTLSSIYKWFVEDFGGDEAGVRQHLAKYAEPALAAKIKTAPISKYDYNWSVNGVVKAKTASKS